MSTWQHKAYTVKHTARRCDQCTAIIKRSIEEYTWHHFACHIQAEPASRGAVSVVSYSYTQAGAGAGHPTFAAGRLVRKSIWVFSEEAVHSLRPQLPAGTSSLIGHPKGVAVRPQGRNGAPTELLGTNPENDSTACGLQELVEMAQGAVTHLLWEYDATRGGWLSSSAILPVHTSSPDGVSVPFRDIATGCLDSYPVS